MVSLKCFTEISNVFVYEKPSSDSLSNQSKIYISCYTLSYKMWNSQSEIQELKTTQKQNKTKTMKEKFRC